MKKRLKNAILLLRKGAVSVVKKKIGVFDSGIGGLSLLLCAARILPDSEFYYYADTDNVPYGEKTQDEIVRLSDRAVGFLYGLGADGVVVACNTATSAAIIDLRRKYENGLGAIPIVGMEPAVKRAIDVCGNGRILAAATPLTVRGAKLRSLIERYDTRRRTDTIPLPGLVRLAEAGDFESGLDYVRIELESAGIDLSAYSALVLGCTHFNYFKDSFRALLPEEARIIDGCGGTARQLIRRLGLDVQRAYEKASSGAYCESVDDIMARTRFFASGRELGDLQGRLRMRACLERLSEMEKIE